MKAIVYHEYGGPEVLMSEEIEKPVAGDREVLIRVRAASVNPLDCGELKGLPSIVRTLLGIRKPTKMQPGRPGVDLAGEVEAIGRNVTRFKPGDRVFGLCVNNPQASDVKVWVHDQGSFAEYVCAPQATLPLKPDNVTFEQAASVPVAALTALQGLRDKGKIQPGQKVLINGAAGGVGTFSVQIAKCFGAEVTGVCRKRNLELVRSIGADYVVDYTAENFTEQEKRYDLIFDCASSHSLLACRQALSPKGIHLAVGDMTGRGGMGILARLMGAFVLSSFASQKFLTFLARPDTEDFATIRELLASERVKPVIDRCYGLSEVPEAIRYVGEKHARGKVVIGVV
jgi:NADPH:quinone reductase-like Zn-dependent oxidoreductase